LARVGIVSSPLRADAVRNRNRLIAAAAELFAVRGVDVPLDEVARSAGVSIGTLYNHFPNRGALIDAVMPDRLAVLDELGEQALSDPDPWHGLVSFLDGMFALQSRDRAMNEAIARSLVGEADMTAECGKAGVLLESAIERAREAGVLRSDFTIGDAVVLFTAMTKVIDLARGDDAVWRRHLELVLDGIRAR
jgi:AcrR family transcriptional regulator